jgi:hypothetical protein
MSDGPTISFRISQGVSQSTDAAIKKIHAFIGELSSTNWVIFTGTAAGGATALVYLVGMTIPHFDKVGTITFWRPDAVTFGMWLGFVASWIGFGVKQFRIKRETADEFSPQNKPKPEGGTS